MIDTASHFWPVFGMVGLALGGIYFLLLYRTASLCAGGGSPWGVLPLFALRILLAAAVFWWAAQRGGLALLLVLAGFLLARLIATRLVRVN